MQPDGYFAGNAACIGPGARKGASFFTADNLLTDTELLWLHTDGRWRKADGSSASAIRLQAGDAYYYLHRGGGFTWTAQE